MEAAAAYQAKKMTADTGAVVLVQAAQSKPHKTRQTALLSSEALPPLLHVTDHASDVALMSI